MGIQLSDLTKEYGNLVAVDDVNLQIADGELFCLLGPSGCGKTTTLRMISGLETPTSGTVSINGKDVTDKRPNERDTSMVFQSWALFPSKTVLENVAFGLKMDGVDKETRRERARELLETVQIADQAPKSPADLSGGQRQRVALARSLARDPHALLLDEPLSNLDEKLKRQMQLEVKRIHDEFDKTTVHVTHDQNEAFTLADKIGIMNHGTLVQVDSPRQIYRRPENRFVEEFLGETNMISGTVERTNGETATVNTSLGDLRIRQSVTDALSVEDAVSLSMRPERLEVCQPDDTADTKVAGEVTDVLYRGSSIRYYITANETSLFIEQSVEETDTYDVGDPIHLDWATGDLLVFDADGHIVEGKT